MVRPIAISLIEIAGLDIAFCCIDLNTADERLIGIVTGRSESGAEIIDSMLPRNQYFLVPGRTAP
ncbi:MAG: hypothetical protein AAF662_12205, partial [Pseudomonadota bacterium]